MKFTVKTTGSLLVPDLQANVTRKAAAYAISKTLGSAGKQVRQEMEAVFDRPIQFTMRAFGITDATPETLSGKIFLKDSHGTLPHYLAPQISGGGRVQTRLEYALRRAGYLGVSERLVPAAGAKLDAAGNLDRGQVRQVLSQLKTDYVAGYTQNASNSTRSRAKRARVSYFFSRGVGEFTGRGTWKNGRQQHLRRGVWLRNHGAGGLTDVVPVYLAVSAVTYRPRLDFFGVVKRTIQERFAGHLRDGMARYKK